MLLRKNEESWPSDLTNVQNELSDDDLELKPNVQSHSETLSHRKNEDFLPSLIFLHSLIYLFCYLLLFYSCIVYFVEFMRKL